MKFRLTDQFIEREDGTKLFRIQCVKSFYNIKEGEYGGYIQDYKNLSQEGNAWVADHAQVYGNALVTGNALVSGNARVYGGSIINDNVIVEDFAVIAGKAQVFNNSIISGNSVVIDEAIIDGDTKIKDNVFIYGKPHINRSEIYGNVSISGSTFICNSKIFDCALITGNASIFDTIIYEKATITSGNISNGIIKGNANITCSIELNNDFLITSNNDFCMFAGFGSANRSTYVYKLQNGEIEIACGCFFGNLSEFEEQVRETHNRTIYEKEYLTIIELIKLKFNL